MRIVTHRSYWTTCVLGLLLGLGISGSSVAQSTNFEGPISAFERQDIKFPPPQDALVITGSSTIRLWTGVRNSLAPLAVIPRGFGGSTADDLDYYLDRIVLPYAPRAVAIYEGDHDLQVGMTPQFVADRMEQIAVRIGTQLPETRIYFIAVKPSPKFWSLWPRAVELNQLLAELCSRTPRCTYINTTPFLLGSNGKFIPGYYRSDRVHFNDAGYQAWTNALAPVLMAGEAGSIPLPDLQSVDVGSVAAAGFSSANGGTVTVDGSGVGAYGSQDGFHYAWKQLVGNGQITARIATQTNTAPDATAGVMLREQLTAGSRHAFVFTTPGAGTGMRYRTVAGNDSVPTVLQGPGIAAPHWLRLVRKANVVSCFRSVNGITWTTCGTVKFTKLKKTVYVGLAVSSFADGILGTASFDNVWIYTATPPPP